MNVTSLQTFPERSHGERSRDHITCEAGGSLESSNITWVKYKNKNRLPSSKPACTSAYVLLRDTSISHALLLWFVHFSAARPGSWSSREIQNTLPFFLWPNICDQYCSELVSSRRVCSNLCKRKVLRTEAAWLNVVSRPSHVCSSVSGVWALFYQ